MSTLPDFVEAQYLKEYALSIAYPIIESLNELNSTLKGRIFDALKVGPHLRQRIDLKSALVERAIKEAESWEMYSDRNDSYDALAYDVWDRFQEGWEDAYPLVLEHERDFIEKSYLEDLENEETDEESVEDYFYKYIADAQPEWFINIITKHLDVDDSFWESLLSQNHSAVEIISERAGDHASFDQHSFNSLFDEICETLDVDLEGSEESDLPNVFLAKYATNEGIGSLELYVERVLYVFNSSVYTPETAQLKSEEIIEILEALLARVPNIEIADTWVTNPTLHYMIPKNELTDLLSLAKDAKSVGMHVSVVIEDIGDLEVPKGVGPCIDSVYICRDRGGSQINFPDFQGDLVLVNNLQTVSWLSAMYLESAGHLSTFINTASPYQVRVGELISCALGNQSRIIVELSNFRRSFDLRIDADAPVNLTFTADPSGKSTTEFCIDVNETVEINLQSYFDNSAEDADLYLGVYLRDMQAMLTDHKPDYLKKVSGIFLSQFDNVERSVLAYNQAFERWRDVLYTNSRSSADFKAVYAGSRSKAHSSFPNLGREGYALPQSSNYPKDQRGKYVAESIATQYDDVAQEGTVYYKCFFPDESYMRTSIAVEPINLKFDLVLSYQVYGSLDMVRVKPPTL